MLLVNWFRNFCTTLFEGDSKMPFALQLVLVILMGALAIVLGVGGLIALFAAIGFLITSVHVDIGLVVLVISVTIVSLFFSLLAGVAVLDLARHK
jgi:hypothetical protein